MFETDDGVVSRRQWLGSLALGVVAAGSSLSLPEADAATRRDLPDLADPEVSLRNIVRM